MTAYKIRYYHKGFIAELLPIFFPDSIVIIIAKSANDAVDKFYAEYGEKKYEIFDIKGIK